MSTYGLKVKDNQGRVLYDTSTVTWIVIDSFAVAADTSISKSYEMPGFTQMKTTLQLINTVPTDQEGYAPIVTIPAIGSVNVATQSGGKSEAAIITVLGR